MTEFRETSQDNHLFIRRSRDSLRGKDKTNEVSAKILLDTHYSSCIHVGLTCNKRFYCSLFIFHRKTEENNFVRQPVKCRTSYIERNVTKTVLQKKCVSRKLFYTETTDTPQRHLPHPSELLSSFV